MQNRIQSFQKKSLVLLVIGVMIGYTISYLLTQKTLSQTTKEVADRNKTLMAIYFPIKKGSFWEYAGIKKEHIDGKIEMSIIHKRVEVNDIAPDSEGDTLSVTQDNHAEQWIVKDNTIDFEPNEPQDKFILTFPLYVGQTWGDDYDLRNRDDGYYMWEVEQKLSQEVLGKTYTECFRIAYKTLPDTTYKIFCYGIGIVEEGYTHNGSLLEETYKLIAYQPHDQDIVQKLSDSETADWQGKTTDWLDRTFDVNNSGKEFERKDLKMTASTGWTIPDEPNTIDKGDLEMVEMNDEYSWKNNSIAKDTLNEADLSPAQRQYFYDNNYVPRSVEHFDVTGDGIEETVVTSLTLGCGRCVDFYITIFTSEGKYIATTNQGTILKTENGNGFYLINYDWSSERTIVNISKYKWDKSLFTEVARKEIVMEQKSQ